MLWFCGLLIQVAMLLGCCNSVSIIRFEVPKIIPRTRSVKLECDFRLEKGETLNSVEWYRKNWRGEMKTFYQYRHDYDNQKPKAYPLPGIKVNMNKSNIRRVTLKRVSVETAGIYRCEVLVKSNNGFSSTRREAKMVVIELPNTKPNITGGLRNYRLGNRLELNCSSPRTYPPTKLKWILNGNPVLDTAPSVVKHSMRHGEKNGLFRSTLGLNLTITSRLFLRGKIKVECIGEVEDGVIQGTWQGDTHVLETIRLPKEFVKKHTQVLVVPLTSSATRPFAATALLLLPTLLLLLLRDVLTTYRMTSKLLL